MPRIVARGLGKKYRIYRHPLARLVEWASRDRRVLHRSEWALRGVSFEVSDGESVGIIGMNGAGKSTLLRLLTGTTQPSEGTFHVEGSVAALLELGLGIHPEFDGWRNAMLSLQLLGLDDRQVRDALPFVQEFSELGSHMDQPVRTYSTGMQVRLAFSVATAVRPDVLIVDEALSVGDTYFQHKSTSRIRAFQEQGTTLLFVTHDPGAVKALCQRALLLDRGALLKDGPPDAVFDYYNAMIARKEEDEQIEQVERDGRTVTRSGSREAEITAVTLHGADGTERATFTVAEPAVLEVRFRTRAAMASPTVGFVIRDRLGNDVFGSNTFHQGIAHQPCTAGDELVARFALGLSVGVGSYSVTVALHTEHAHVDANFDWWDRALLFDVVPGDGPGFTGVAALPVRASLERTGG
ncbi:MAG: ABC transporter ATP-binding protein [Candidatus Binatia bacterium]